MTTQALNTHNREVAVMTFFILKDNPYIKDRWEPFVARHTAALL